MDWNRVEGNWKEMKGKVKEQWGKLTDDDLDVIAGKQDQLEGRLQQRYGYAKNQAQKEVNSWYGRQKCIPPAETVLFGDRLPRKHVALRLALRSVDAGR
ncbi:uncharacterized protein YjbJ (UPF0337 family), partial [Bradyrhizobium sp. LB11.1]